jgi:hypothetical protein
MDKARSATVVLVTLVASMVEVPSANAAESVASGEITSMSSGGFGVYSPDPGSARPILDNYIRNNDTGHSSVVYTLSPEELKLGAKYEVSTPEAVRVGVLPRVHWLAAKHGRVRGALDYWPEQAAVQLCIWAQRDGAALSASNTSDMRILRRAVRLCSAVREANPSADSPFPRIHRRVSLKAAVRRATAGNVTIKTRLADAANNEGLPGQSLDVSYDEIERHVKTLKGGAVEMVFPRRDDHVSFHVHYQGEYDVGLPWVSTDGTGPVVVAAEKFPVEFNEEVDIDPSHLTSGVSLAYQEIGDFVSRHTPLPAQPGAAIGLVVLMGGWVIALGRGTWGLFRKKRPNDPGGSG